MPPPDPRYPGVSPAYLEALAAMRKRFGNPSAFPVPMASDEHEVTLDDDELYSRLLEGVPFPEGFDESSMIDAANDVMTERGWRRGTDDDPEFTGQWTMPWDAYPPFAQDAMLPHDPAAMEARRQYPDNDPGPHMPVPTDVPGDAYPGPDGQWVMPGQPNPYLAMNDELFPGGEMDIPVEFRSKARHSAGTEPVRTWPAGTKVGPGNRADPVYSPSTRRDVEPPTWSMRPVRHGDGLFVDPLTGRPMGTEQRLDKTARPEVPAWRR